MESYAYVGTNVAAVLSGCWTRGFGPDASRAPAAPRARVSPAPPVPPVPRLQVLIRGVRWTVCRSERRHVLLSLAGWAWPFIQSASHSAMGGPSDRGDGDAFSDPWSTNGRLHLFSAA